MSVTELLVVRLPEVLATREEIEASIARMGLGEPVTAKFDCHLFEDFYSGEQRRDIGALFYSPLYERRRGGAWRLCIRPGALPSDVLVILGLMHGFMSKGPQSTSTLNKFPFSDTGNTFRSIGVCRPLDDYTGDELFTMVALPVDVEASMILETSQDEAPATQPFNQLSQEPEISQ